MATRLYGSVISWEGWQFAVVSSAAGISCVNLRATSLAELGLRIKKRIIADDTRNECVLKELREYLAGDRRAFTCSLDYKGTPFQMAVWKEIASVPYGQTTSYGELAVQIGRPNATRAVGQAAGANPVPIVIPCHRVIGKDGSLVGYGGGLPLKERLLALEQGSLDL